jgi:hypothetical protein
MLMDSISQASNLIRVRNNQRRSRARRREYIAELERKVHEYNAQGLPPCTPHIVPQDTILRLENENRKLREMLALAGVELDLGGVPEVADNANPLQRLETAQDSLVSLRTVIYQWFLCADVSKVDSDEANRRRSKHAGWLR